MHDLLNELNILAFEIAPIFYKVLFMSLTAVCIGVIIMLVRHIADKRISPVWKYILWGLMLVALLVPYRPQSNFALIQNTTQIEDISFRQQYDDIKYEFKIMQQTEKPTEEEQSTINNLKNQVSVTYLKSSIFDIALPLLWVFGMVSAFVFLIASKITLSNKIKKHTIKSEKYNDLLLECKNKLDIKSDIRIVVQDYIASPALMGIINPKILLPKYIEEMSKENLSYIILHELAHFKRQDMIVNYLMLALQAVYWFNPLIWVLFKFIREDMELLNDTYVLNHVGYEKSKYYARSLVEVLGHAHNISIVPKLLCMVDGKKNVERRISMIKLGETFKKYKIIISMACLLIICVVSALLLTSGGKLSYYKDIGPESIEISTDKGMITKELDKEQSKHLEGLLEYDTWERDYFSELYKLKIATMNVISYGDEKLIWVYHNMDDYNLYFSVGSEKGEIYKAPKHIWDNIFEFAHAYEIVNTGIMTEENDPQEFIEIESVDAPVTTDLEQSISNAILSFSADIGYEAVGEGHIIYDIEEKSGKTYVYIHEMSYQFGFENGILTEVSGGANPSTLVFEKDGAGNYILKEFIRSMGYLEEMQKMFSDAALKKYLEADWEKIGAEMSLQVEAYAKAYLKEIGRKADFQPQIDRVHIKMDVDISNYLLNTYYDYPYWIGSLEKIENGIRYIYETLWEDKGNQNGILTFEKKTDTGEVVERTVIEIKGSEMECIEGILRLVKK